MDYRREANVSYPIVLIDLRKHEHTISEYSWFPMHISTMKPDTY